ncbi:MAG: putative ABC transporter permease subunit [Eubacteriales bacterium]|jgi:ABC-2 type transport system permease protein
MSDFLKVFRIQLRSRFSLKAASKKELMKSIGIGSIVILSFGSIISAWCFLLYGFFAGLEAMNMLDLGLLMPFIAGMVVVLIFGVAGVLGVLFQSKDITFLASLPLKQGAVFASKFFLVYLYELAIMICFILPAIFVYGSIAGSGLLFYIKGILATLFLPMLPLIISTLISLLLMRFSGLTKRRDLIAIIGGFVLVIAYMLGQQYLMSRVSQMSQEELMVLLAQANSLVGVIGRAFPPALWAVNAVTQTGTDSLINWALYLLSAGVAFAITYYVGSKLYLSGALAQLETAKSGKAVDLNESTLRSGSRLRAMALREFKMIMRSPIYALNSLIGVVLFPIMLFIFPMMSSTDSDVKELVSFISSVPQSMLFIVALGIGLLFSTLNTASSTVLSREGEYFWLSKVIPVPYSKQVYGKLIFCWAISAATILLSMIVACILFPEFILKLIPACLCSLIGAVSLTAVSMIIDIARPKLKWSSESEAMKQNINSMLAMIAAVALGFIYVIVSVLLMKILSDVIAIVLVFVFVTVTAFVSVSLLGKLANYKYQRIEP